VVGKTVIQAQCEPLYLNKMMQKLSIKMIAPAVLLCAVWLWYAMSSDTVPEAVSSAHAQSGTVNVNNNAEVSGLLFSDAGLNDELATKFQTAVRLIEQQENQAAITQLNEIIKKQPHAIEPYINLASLYAKSNNIDQASETLKKAIKANSNTAVLFESLQSLYAAQASLAYQRALEIDTIDDESLAVNLPVIKTLMVDKPDEAELALREHNRELLLQAAKNEEAFDELQSKFRDSNQEKAALLSSNAKLRSANQQQTALIGTQSDVESELTIKLKTELQQAEQKIAVLERQHAEKITALQNESNRKIAVLQFQVDQASISSTVIASVENPAAQNETANRTKADNTSIAIDLVRAWARSWAEQDVPAYISFYENQFRPSNGLSNKQWRDQRKVRLTNKSYIKVDVSNFKVEDRDTQFRVTFSQHYRSNNVDDRITKRLIFNKKNEDWSKAKITSEQVIVR